MEPYPRDIHALDDFTGRNPPRSQRFWGGLRHRREYDYGVADLPLRHCWGVLTAKVLRLASNRTRPVKDVKGTAETLQAVAGLAVTAELVVYYQLQAEKHLSVRTIFLVCGTLIQMYDHAIDMQLVENNPARNSKLLKQRRTVGDEDKKVISIAQREALLKAAADDPIIGPPVTMLMLTRMRVGEMLALQWRHIDFSAKMITIQQSLTRELTFDKEGRTEKSEGALGATKTRTFQRVIQAPALVLDRLREWMKYVASRTGGLVTLVPDGFVFISTRTMGMRTYSGLRNEPPPVPSHLRLNALRARG